MDARISDAEGIVKRANRIQNQVWALTAEYLEQMRSHDSLQRPEERKVSQRGLDYGRVQHIFQGLQLEVVSDSLRQARLQTMADRLDDLLRVSRLVFDLRTASRKVVELEPLSTELQSKYHALGRELVEFATRDWTRNDYIVELRGLDNAGLLDEVNDEFFRSMSDTEFRAVYESIDEFSYTRAIAWQNDYAMQQIKAIALASAMYETGETASTIAESLNLSVEEVQGHLIRTMDDLGESDEAMRKALNVSQARIDEVLRPRRISDVVDTGCDPDAADAEHFDEAEQALHLAVAFHSARNLPQARTWYEKSAAAGSIQAMGNLGVLLALDWGPPDLTAASAWYEKAAAAGDVVAMYNLGVLLASLLENPDLSAAREWYEKAANAGHSGAMYNLGVLLSCAGREQDLEAARIWLEKAAIADSRAGS